MTGAEALTLARNILREQRRPTAAERAAVQGALEAATDDLERDVLLLVDFHLGRRSHEHAEAEIAAHEREWREYEDHVRPKAPSAAYHFDRRHPETSAAFHRWRDARRAQPDVGGAR